MIGHISSEDLLGFTSSRACLASIADDRKKEGETQLPAKIGRSASKQDERLRSAD